MASSTSRRLRLLLTNDDGILAPGLVALYEALCEEYDVTVVAPADERSASGHAITVHHHLSVKKIMRHKKFYGYAVDGTPADCVKWALCELMKIKPDLCVSGINPGPNTGISVFYSGTISAAREAVISGIPSIAVSLNKKNTKTFTVAAKVCQKIVRVVSQLSLPAYVMLNVNVPAIPYTQLRGMKLTKQAHSRFVEEFEITKRRNNKIDYFLKGEMVMIEKDKQSDEEALKNKYVSISPLKLDLTDQLNRPQFRRLIRTLQD